VCMCVASLLFRDVDGWLEHVLELELRSFLVTAEEKRDGRRREKEHDTE